MLSGIPVVEVTRGPRVESLHAVAACVCDVEGRLVVVAGDVDEPVFLRSTAKPLITAAAVRAGVVERFGFGDRELALMSASHNGEPEHVALVERMLGAIGADVRDLQCGAHAPMYEPAAAALTASGAEPSALHNNCSGKHAGILALARILGAPLATYLEPVHPAQRAILALCERVVGEALGPERLGVDGCGVPVFATSLRHAAIAFARIATLRDLDDADGAAVRRVRDAIAAEPFYLAGTARYDTDLVGATRGDVVGKAGAEGVHGDAWIGGGLGLALKVIDGTRRAVPAAAIALLDAVGALDPAAAAALAGHARTAVANHAHRAIGEIRALPAAFATAVRQPTAT